MYLCTFVLTINFFFIALKKFRENNDFTKEVNKEMIPRNKNVNFTKCLQQNAL